jgi:hypothetical protein
MAATCRSCRAPVRWVETTSGKRMPLDPENTWPYGNVIILHEDVAKVLGMPPSQGPSYTSHFATCPNASTHRRRG